MHKYQYEFIEFALAHKALCFGDFTLKSGRISPYFFNAGLFNTGKALAKLGYYYASAIRQADLEYDVLFGPAYKGIPLVSATAIALAEYYEDERAYCFNRKEIKDHGEGGLIIGAKLAGRIVIIDDVITAGTAIHQSMELIKEAGARLTAVVIALDRQECGQSALSAIQELEHRYQTRVISIINFNHLITYLGQKSDMQEYLEQCRLYRESYGV